MVDVTIENFAQLRPQIESELRNAMFVAIDTEFTCLLAEEKFSNEWFDTGPERYAKLRQNLDQVAINQLGLAICLPLPDRSHYHCRVYNIYVGPVSFLDLDSTILCQASSLAFLAQHGFDFNKWLYNGVPHLSRQQRQEAASRLAALADGTGNVNLPHTAKDAVRAVLEWASTAELADQFIVQDPAACAGTPSSSPASSRYRDPSMAPAVIATINNTCPDLFAAVGTDGLVLVIKVGEKERAELRDAATAEWHRLTNDSLNWLSGVSHLMWQLARNKKPVMLHNGLIDLMLLYKQFFMPLPKTMQMFKKAIRKEFPMVYDTKVLAHSVKREHKECADALEFLGHSNLALLAASLINCHVALFKPSLTIVPVEHKYRGKAFLHEAGYDAYLTAHCYLQLAHLGHTLKLPQGVSQRHLEPREHVTALKYLGNRINVMRASILYLALDGPDKVAPRPPWLIVENLSELRTAIAERRVASTDLRQDCQPAPGDTRALDLTIPDVIKQTPRSKDNQSNSHPRLPSVTQSGGFGSGSVVRLDVNSNLILIKPGARPKFTPDCVSALLSRYGSVDVRPWHRNKMLVAAASFDAHRRILTDFRVPGFRVYPYNPFKHSLLARGTLWSGLLVSGGLSAFLFYSCLKTDK